MKKKENREDFSKSGDEIRLTTSGLYFTAQAAIPHGIRARDLDPLARGLVEEHSPLPPEQTAWGFLLDSRPKKGGRLFYYAAARELVFGKGGAGASDLSAAAVLPGFAALSGLRFAEATWIYLLEETCLSAVLFEANTTVPSLIFPRFLAEDNGEAFTTREALAARARAHSTPGTEVEGIVRIARAAPRGQGVEFSLERQKGPSDEWKSWKRTAIAKPTRVRAADVRDRAILWEGARQKTSNRRMGAAAIAVLATVLFLSALEILEYRRGSETRSLQTLAAERTPAVDRLRGIEAMTGSLRNVFEKDFRPYLWLMALNEQRPSAINFTSFALDDGGRIRANGLAPEIKILNDYLALLRKDPRFGEVDTGSVDTDEDGVRFSLNARAGDLTAGPPVSESPEEAEATDVSTEATGGDTNPTEDES